MKLQTIKVPAELAEKLSAIYWDDRTVPIHEIIAPLIRDTVNKKFAALPAGIRKVTEQRIAAKTRPERPATIKIPAPAGARMGSAKKPDKFGNKTRAKNKKK